MPSFFPNQRSGFTLIELMVSISIVAILSTIGVLIFRRAETGGRELRRKQDMGLISQALELYYQTNKRYPFTDSNNDFYQYSNNPNPPGASFWLSDRGNSTTPVIDFGSKYISGVPIDPINTTPYVYAYYSPPENFGSCLAGKYYILFATLENSNDPDRFDAHPYSVCSRDLSQTSFFNGKYVVFGGVN